VWADRTSKPLTYREWQRQAQTATGQFVLMAQKGREESVTFSCHSVKNRIAS